MNGAPSSIRMEDGASSGDQTPLAISASHDSEPCGLVLSLSFDCLHAPILKF